MLIALLVIGGKLFVFLFELNLLSVLIKFNLFAEFYIRNEDLIIQIVKPTFVLLYVDDDQGQSLFV